MASPLRIGDLREHVAEFGGTTLVSWGKRGEEAQPPI